MAYQSQPIGLRLAAWTAAALVLVLVLGTLLAVLWRAEGPGGLRSSDLAAIRFTVLQAALSAGFSIVLAVPVARALARQRFPGRGALIAAFGAPFLLPVIVAVLGLLAVFGRNGWLNSALGAIGLPLIDIYGLHGVVLAHVFFNLPLATRLLLQGWLSIPAEEFRLAASLGFGPRDVVRYLERPMLWRVVPGAALVIFLLCMTSFAVVLALGGGPRATTIELAIYQAFRFDFDLARAAMLALVQVALAGSAAMLALAIGRPSQIFGGLDRVTDRWDGHSRRIRMIDGTSLSLAAMFLALPLAAVLGAGFQGMTSLDASVTRAAMRSLAVATGSVLLTGVLVLPMAVWIGQSRQNGAAKTVEAIGYLMLAASPLVIGTGLFILVYPVADPIALALPVTALVNALMALPFALRALVPTVEDTERQFGRLADSLSIAGWARFRMLTLPRLRRPLGFALGLTAALSMGDLGVVALFSDPEAATLPLQMYRLMSAYRMEQAAAAGLLLVAMAVGIFWVFDRGGRMNADT